MAEPRPVGIYGAEALPWLHTDGYWQIWSMDIYGPRPIALVNNEAARQQRFLDSLANRLVERCGSFHGDDEIFVVDTNVFMHYHTLNEPGRWCDEYFGDHRESWFRCVSCKSSIRRSSPPTIVSTSVPRRR